MRLDRDDCCISSCTYDEAVPSGEHAQQHPDTTRLRPTGKMATRCMNNQGRQAIPSPTSDNP